MWFRFRELDGDGVAHRSTASRKCVLGGPVEWTLNAGSDDALKPIGGTLSLDSIGRLLIGPIEYSYDRTHWNSLNSLPASLCPNLADEPLRMNAAIRATTTYMPHERLKHQYRVLSEISSAGSLILLLGATDTNRIQELLDNELPALPRSGVSLFIQDGWSDIDALHWLAHALTAEAARADDTAVVTLTGSDGAGWYLVPLHQLNKRSQITCAVLPEALDSLSFLGWVQPRMGTYTQLRFPEAACALLRGEVVFRPEQFLRRSPEATVLPLRLPKNVKIHGGPATIAEWWVVGMTDTFTHDKRHVIELVLSRDPAETCSPSIQGLRYVGGLYVVEVVSIPDGVPDWTVACRFSHYPNSGEVPICLSTLYSGKNQLEGIHILPEVGSKTIVAWTGRLSDPPTSLLIRRPSSTEKSGSDVRDLGVFSVRLPIGRGLDMELLGGSVSTKLAGKDNNLTVASDGTVCISSLNQVMLERSGGRSLIVGQERIDIE